MNAQSDVRPCVCGRFSARRRVCRIAAVVVLAVAGPGVQHADPAEAAPPELERLRLIVETDAGGDPDDEQSLVRFLVYASEWDVEGIIANRPVTLRPENRSRKGSGFEIVREFIDAY